MDRFSEQLLQKRNTGRDTVIRVLYCLGAAVLAAAAAAATPFVGLVLPIAVIAGIIWLLVWLLQGTMVEYEYIVTNDDLDIDKITGRRKRKRMVTVSLRGVKSLAEYTSGSVIDADVTVMAHDESGENMYCLICNITEYGDVAVIFNPNNRTLYNMIGGFSPKVKHEYEELYKRVTPAEEESEETADTDNSDIKDETDNTEKTETEENT